MAQCAVPSLRSPVSHPPPSQREVKPGFPDHTHEPKPGGGLVDTCRNSGGNTPATWLATQGAPGGSLAEACRKPGGDLAEIRRKPGGIKVGICMHASKSTHHPPVFLVFRLSGQDTKSTGLCAWHMPPELFQYTRNLLYFNPPSPSRSVFRRFQAYAAAVTGRSLGGTRVRQKLAGLPPPYVPSYLVN